MLGGKTGSHAAFEADFLPLFAIIIKLDVNFYKLFSLGIKLVYQVKLLKCRI